MQKKSKEAGLVWKGCQIYVCKVAYEQTASITLAKIKHSISTPTAKHGSGVIIGPILQHCERKSWNSKFFGSTLVAFCDKFIINKRIVEKKWASWMSASNNYELLPMSVNKRTKKLTFWVRPILMKKQQQGGFHGLIQELKLWSWNHIRRGSEIISVLIDPSQSFLVTLLSIVSAACCR